MQYITEYSSPLGSITLAGDGERLTGLWFNGQKYFCPPEDGKRSDTPVFRTASDWLDIYFQGRQPDFEVPVLLNGTVFQTEVWDILRRIPYGQVTTYGAIAGAIAEKRGCKTMSAQAVGGAVGRNPISIIVPCHRVLGSGGSLTGYAGGIQKKRALLALEKAKLI